MTTQRAIVVLCLPRSGSSAVAGALHRMGVDMGEGHLQKADPLNKRGYYEDLRWQAISKRLAGYRYSAIQPRELTPWARMATLALLSELDDVALWGFKSPRAAFTWHLLEPIVAGSVDDLRIVTVFRPFPDVVASLIRHSERAYGGQERLTGRAAETLLINWHNALNRRLSQANARIWQVNFYDLLDNTKEELKYLERFAFENCEHLSNGIEEAVSWVDPGLVTQ